VSHRFISNMLLALAGGLVLVVTQAFAPPVVAWIAFGVTGVGVLLLIVATALAPGRGNVQRMNVDTAQYLDLRMAVDTKRSTKRAPVALSTSYLIGLAFIGISTITLKSLARSRPAVTRSRFISGSYIW